MTTPTMPRAIVRRGDTTGITLATVALAAAALEILLATTSILTRPPCAPGYVRLIDFAPIAIGWGGLNLLASAGLLLAAFRVRTGGRTWPLRTAAVLLLALALPLGLLTGVDLLVASDQQYDSSCWTF